LFTNSLLFTLPFITRIYYSYYPTYSNNKSFFRIVKF